MSFVLAEAGLGIAANSLALLADAGHNLSDVLGLLLAWGAGYLARRRPTERRTYGLRRSTILAALLNAVLLLIAVGAITWEAIGRLDRPASVAGGTVIAVAAVGVVVNTVTALLFFSGRRHDPNIRGAFLHMAADAVVSLGVVVAGIVIGLTGWAWVDPAVSLLIAAVIAVGTWGLLRQSIDLSLDAVPTGIDPSSVRTFLAGLPGVVEVHDLHIWGMSTTETALTVHLVKPGAGVDDDWLAWVSKELHDRFRIDHATIQIECGRVSQPCNLTREGMI
ncbi:MAG: cation diffusion facilitator family transporter [Gemmataceae bacterium]|nr:cation diffusion facilitator family transporter [Gemmataceae bacterium]